MTNSAAAHPDIIQTTSTQIAAWLQSWRGGHIRSMLEFAEETVRVPNGPYAGRRYKTRYQPYTRLYFEAVDSGQYNDIYAVGPTQSGKTLTCYVIPILYHMVELQETVVSGVPIEDIASDKWREDILPVIRRSGRQDLLPRRGAASQGGKIDVVVTLTNGAALRFMAGGGSDKTRSSYTARVLAVTEADGLDVRGGTSAEADKLTQLMGRTLSYGSRRRHYMECTTSTDEGAIWRGYIYGTESRICIPCGHCGEYVTPEREHFRGWQNAEDEMQAREQGRIHCPKCDQPWTEQMRIDANHKAVLAHKGQTVDKDGNINGEPPRTKTLGFRWNCCNNLFVSQADIAAKEWKAARDPNEDNAEREMLQQWWALPYTGQREEMSQVTSASILKREIEEWPQGVCPPDTKNLILSVDVGKSRCHWVALAQRESGAIHLVEYGILEVSSDTSDTETALRVALGELNEYRDGGWQRYGTEETLHGDLVVVDSGYETKTIYSICKAHDGWYAVKGFGQSQAMASPYRSPSKKTPTVRHLGDEYHVVKLSKELGRGWLIEGNADAWKSRVHDRLRLAMDHEFAMTICSGRSNHTISKHLTSERQVEEYDPKRGNVIKWERILRNNHWFDACWMGLMAVDWVDLGMPGLARRASGQKWAEGFRKKIGR